MKEKKTPISLFHPSYSPKCFPFIKKLRSNLPVCGSSKPLASPLSSPCSFLHKDGSLCSSPIWGGKEGKVVAGLSLRQHSQPAARICIECSSDHRTCELKTKLGNFLCKGSNSKYFRLCRLCDVCYNHSALPL